MAKKTKIECPVPPSQHTFIPIEQSDAYKMMSEEQQQKVTGLYISKDPVVITKDSATYQNGGNGILNNEGLATFNVLEQTGMIGQYQNDKNKEVEVTVFYNPTSRTKWNSRYAGIEPKNSLELFENSKPINDRRFAFGDDGSIHQFANSNSPNVWHWAGGSNDINTPLLPNNTTKSLLRKAFSRTT